MASKSDALCAAVESGDYAEVAKLLEQDADPNHVNERGLTPLVISLKNVNPAAKATTKLLITSGADVNGNLADTKYLPLFEACLRCNESGVRSLLRGGADVMLTDNESRNVLHWCAIGGSASLMRSLDAHTNGTLRDAFDQSGYTPLMLAAEHGRLDTVKYLIDAGCDRSVKNSAGHGAADLAEWFGHKAVHAALVDVPALPGISASQAAAGMSTPTSLATVAMQGLSLSMEAAAARL